MKKAWDTSSTSTTKNNKVQGIIPALPPETTMKPEKNIWNNAFQGAGH